MARYFSIGYPDSVKDQVVVELGSGTGIGGLALLKYTDVNKVVFTDYQQPVLNLIGENIVL